MKPKKTPLIKDIGELRRRLNINQSDFWSAVGVTQSAGSRYESGRQMPITTRLVSDLVYLSPKKALQLLADLRGDTIEDLKGE